MKLSLVAVLALVPAALAQEKGSITAPTPGQHIAPGQNFTFKYFGRADYGVSSYDYSVWLVNSTVFDKKLSFEDVFTNGWFFGRYDYANYPAVPYSTHPAPKQLSMPNFTKPQGGFGAGQTASKVNFTLLVIEEYADGGGSVGRKLGTAGVPIVYN
ncbi:hypothetical protein EIP91_006152 [Steccherinum ochraceum]|uniref:Uncharacterized protein n=1 Tax=Steccherinum ochraceum TaxID=92696 RepID=A0A4R0R8Z2_9APHY|nr:hypothetical protein EIP91_006152 [Steccherinum ochraceum]